MRKIAFIGSAFGYGAQITATDLGPSYILNEYNLIDKMTDNDIRAYWHKSVIINNYDLSAQPNKGKHFNAVLEHNRELFSTTKQFIETNKKDIPIIIGGDHSCAIGTWSGIIDGLNAHKEFGLIWIDAHMDAHIYETSPSKAYHGMPVSVLLGRGDDNFLSIGNSPVKINPKHLVLIGIRSFEPDEEAFLNTMGVKCFTSEDVSQLGMKKVFQEALSIVEKAQHGFGISFDLDAIDPKEAPGVGSPEPNGLRWDQMKKNLSLLFKNPKFKALEITEFNPERDRNNLTADILFETVYELGKELCFIQEPLITA